MSSEPRLICPQCGHDNPYDFLICGQCGADLLIEPVDQDLDTVAITKDSAETADKPVKKKDPNSKLATEEDDEMARIQEQIRDSSSSNIFKSLYTSIEWNLNLGNIAIICWIVFLLVYGVKYLMDRADDIPYLHANPSFTQSSTDSSLDQNGVNGNVQSDSSNPLNKNIELPAGSVKAIVKDVKSAEVIEVFDPEKETSALIRLIGIQAPEAYPNGTNEKGSVQAYQYLSSKIKDKEIGLLYGDTRTEVGVPWKARSFAYVYFDGEMLNLDMITKGLVIVGDPAPNVNFSRDFIQAQTVAKKQKLGLWAD